jgi:MFS family permease
LRLLNGVVAGFNPAAISLTSASTPKERIGFAMGWLQAAGVAGLIMGPLLGSLLADAFASFRPVFFITGGLMALTALLMLIFIKESFDREQAARQQQVSLLADFRKLLQNRGVGSLFFITFILQFSLFSTLPLLALFVQEMTNNSEHVVLYAGLIGAVTGIANLVASPILGWLGDRVGHKYILLASLAGAVITLLPQAFIEQWPLSWFAPFWLFLALRFLFGIFMGGMVPSINALLRILTPDGMESRTYGFNSSFLSLGNFFGPLCGGWLASQWGISSVFLFSTALMLINLIWLLRVVKHKELIA